MQKSRVIYGENEGCVAFHSDSNHGFGIRGTLDRGKSLERQILSSLTWTFTPFCIYPIILDIHFAILW